MEGGALWALRRSTHQRRANLGHNRGSLYALCPIFTPLTPFYWVVNISVTKLSACRLIAVDVDAETLRPQLKALSSRRDGLLSDLDHVY